MAQKGWGIATLDFNIYYSYHLGPEGILIPVQLAQADKSVDLTARLDTGAADCLLDRFFAEVLGIDVEAGIRQTYRAVAGSFIAYGHEMTLRTFELEWSALVYFYTAATRQDNFIGRRGWLDRVRLGLIHYDQQIYLSQYDEGQ